MTFSKVQLDKIIHDIGRVKTAGEAAGALMISELAELYRRDVIKNYRAGAGTPLTRSTIEARQQGKRAGVYPARAGNSSPHPLIDTGHMVGLVRTYKRKRNSWSVQIHPSGRARHGGNASKVAAMLEFGATMTIGTSVRMRSYLRALALGVAGSSVNVSAPATPAVLVIRIPPRPIWMPAFVAMVRKQPIGEMGFGTIFAKHFRKTYGYPLKVRAM
jgi:hypothetical protein